MRILAALALVVAVAACGGGGDGKAALASCTGRWNLTETVTSSDCPGGVFAPGTTSTDAFAVALTGGGTAATIDLQVAPGDMAAVPYGVPTLATNGSECFLRGTWDRNATGADSRQTFDVQSDPAGHVLLGGTISVAFAFSDGTRCNVAAKVTSGTVQ